jgi:hypothetical protein
MLGNDVALVSKEEFLERYGNNLKAHDQWLLFVE